jgi:hypothetical protein
MPAVRWAVRGARTPRVHAKARHQEEELLDRCGPTRAWTGPVPGHEHHLLPIALNFLA